MLTNEVAARAPGEGSHALLLTDQGRVIADMRAYVLAESIWLDVPAASREAVREALERYIVADDVEIEVSTRAGVAIRGPAAAEVLAVALGGDASGLDEVAHRDARVGGEEVRLVRVSDLGVDGFHLWCADAESTERIFAALLAAGAIAAPEAALEAQRIVAGVARHGVEYDLKTLAPEVPSFERAISYRKGCYLGQEVVERVAARGHVNWKIASLRGTTAFPAGATVSSGGREVGHVTSATQRPDDHSTWGLARIRRDAAEPGTELRIGAGGEAVAAEVVAEGRNS
jgi:folate-binding protein YgfZ